MTYYRRDLSLVHHKAFGAHPDNCAPGILRLLEPVRSRGGTVLELGCGSGALTRRLTDAGHRVVATDASPDMLDLACAHVPGARFERLVLPDDPLPEADAVVAVGHVLSYLPDEAAVERGLAAVAGALRPGGILALDICDLEWGRARRDTTSGGWAGDDWALVTRFSVPSPARFVREMAVFTRNEDGTWRRDDERHDNVLFDTARIPGLLAGLGVDAEVGDAFGDERLPAGLRAVTGRRTAQPGLTTAGE